MLTIDGTNNRDVSLPLLLRKLHLHHIGHCDSMSFHHSFRSDYDVRRVRIRLFHISIAHLHQGHFSSGNRHLLSIGETWHLRRRRDQKIRGSKGLSDRVDATCDSVTSRHVESGGVRPCRLGEKLFGECGDGVSDGMLRESFGGSDEEGDESEGQLGGVDKQGELHDTGTALRNGSSLVEHDRRHFVHTLQRLPALDQYPIRGSHSCSNHDCCRRGETQTARTGDSQDCDGSLESHFQRLFQSQCTRQIGIFLRVVLDDNPDGKGQKRESDDKRHEVSGDSIGELLDRGPVCLGFLDESDDLSKGRLVADVGCFHDQDAFLVDGSTDYGTSWKDTGY